MIEFIAFMVIINFILINLNERSSLHRDKQIIESIHKSKDAVIYNLNK